MCLLASPTRCSPGRRASSTLIQSRAGSPKPAHPVSGPCLCSGKLPAHLLVSPFQDRIDAQQLRPACGGWVALQHKLAEEARVWVAHHGERVGVWVDASLSHEDGLDGVALEESLQSHLEGRGMHLLQSQAKPSNKGVSSSSSTSLTETFGWCREESAHTRAFLHPLCGSTPSTDLHVTSSATVCAVIWLVVAVVAVAVRTCEGCWAGVFLLQDCHYEVQQHGAILAPVETEGDLLQAV